MSILPKKDTLKEAFRKAEVAVGKTAQFAGIAMAYAGMVDGQSGVMFSNAGAAVAG
jgi:hypothetical protein